MSRMQCILFTIIPFTSASVLQLTIDEMAYTDNLNLGLVLTY